MIFVKEVLFVLFNYVFMKKVCVNCEEVVWFRGMGFCIIGTRAVRESNYCFICILCVSLCKGVVLPKDEKLNPNWGKSA